MVKNVEKPVVVAGDFNVFRGDREFQLFAMEGRFKTANNESHPYYFSRSPMLFTQRYPDLTGWTLQWLVP